MDAFIGERNLYIVSGYKKPLVRYEVLRQTGRGLLPIGRPDHNFTTVKEATDFIDQVFQGNSPAPIVKEKMVKRGYYVKALIAPPDFSSGKSIPIIVFSYFRINQIEIPCTL